ncbi:hypothetical protein KKI23_01050 [Patescibacteria group bacterium]|nr:hypothetical protein [Patescibacteria group bacterium]
MSLVDGGNLALMPIAGLELALGFFILWRKPRTIISISYSLLIFSIVLWVFANGYGFLVDSHASHLFWWKLSFIGASGVAGFILLFSWIFPFPKKEINIYNYLIVFLPIIGVAVLLMGDWLVSGVDYSSGIPIITVGSWQLIFAAYFIIWLSWGIVNLAKKYKESDGIHRWQLKWILVGLGLPAIFGMLINLILPIFGVQTGYWDWLGTGSSIIWLAITSYIIFKKP